MKKYLLILMAAFAVCSCSYDDDALWDEVNGLKSEVAALQSLIDALNKGKVITDVEENENGYTLTFNDGSTVSIKNGVDGEEGKDGENGDSQFKSVELDGNMVIITLSDGNVLKFENKAIRILTFEDADAKFTPYLMNDQFNIGKWSDLIDNPQYGGPLTYADMVTTNYYWYDENNTFLTSAIIDGGAFWNGGHVISNYASTDIVANGDYMQQLTVYGEPGKGGHNGSANFCIHNGYVDEHSWSQTLPAFEFKDGVARIIDHLYITSTTYFINAYINGNSFSKPTTDDDWFKVVATGYDGEGNKTAETEFFLGKGKTAVQTWEKWDLSSLGKVQKVTFNLVGTDTGDYGLNTPAYFAYDDVAVKF